jgi:hypothetical protein
MQEYFLYLTSPTLLGIVSHQQRATATEENMDDIWIAEQIKLESPGKRHTEQLSELCKLILNESSNFHEVGCGHGSEFRQLGIHNTESFDKIFTFVHKHILKID